jgi:hypothetical protein
MKYTTLNWHYPIAFGAILAIAFLLTIEAIGARGAWLITLGASPPCTAFAFTADWIASGPILALTFLASLAGGLAPTGKRATWATPSGRTITGKLLF